VENICPALNVIPENHKKFQPSTFQCSAQGTFHTNMRSSHFYLLTTFANCFHTSIWKGGSNTSFGLIKEQCIIFLLLIWSLSLWPTFPGPMLLASPAVPQTQETRKALCIRFVAQPICTNSNLRQIIQSCSSTMVPGTDYSDIGFYCSYRL